MATKDNNMADLIPDYCSDRLAAAERADFERRLQVDQELLAELNDFREFQQLYHKIDPVEPTPSDALFHQISRQINVQQKVAAKAPRQASPLADSLRSLWQQLRESVTVPWMLAAVQAVAIALLLIPAPRQDTYSTLSATHMAVQAETVGINVVFQPNALESDIRRLLQSIQGSVSSGPSREGRYVVSVSKQSDLENVVRTLKQSKIVLFAEPAN